MHRGRTVRHGKLSMLGVCSSGAREKEIVTRFCSISSVNRHYWIETFSRIDTVLFK